MFTSITAVGHFKAKLADSIDTVGSVLVILMQSAEGMIFPVVFTENVHSELLMTEVVVAGKHICAMYAELVTVFWSHSVIKPILYLDLLPRILRLIIIFCVIVRGVYRFPALIFITI